MAPGILFKSNFVTVDTVPATTPEGVEYDHARVTPRSPYGSIIIPLHGEGDDLHLGFVSQFRPVTGQRSLEFPRGSTADLGDEEAVRELVEEMGLPSIPDSISLLGHLHPDTGLLSTEVAVWKTHLSTEDMERSRSHVEAFSGVQPEWISYQAVRALIAKGGITCGMTLAALTLLQFGESPSA